MMYDLAWLFIGGLAILATFVSVSTSDNAIAMVVGAIGFFAWLLWSFGAFSGVETADGTAFTVWPLALFGVALAFLPGFISLTGPLELFADAGERGIDDI